MRKGVIVDRCGLHNRYSIRKLSVGLPCRPTHEICT
ncbi:YSIRK-type signal peptide-containing protein [Thiocapsa imhoffii]